MSAENAITLRVDGMTCASCVRRVERSLAKVDGVEAASVNFASETARVTLNEGLDAQVLVDAVQRIYDGDAVFSPRLAGFVLDAFSADLDAPADPELDQLTAREQEVMRLLARGYAYKEIARRLTISIKTVETHASSVLRKLQLSNRNELARWAADRRIV